MRPYATRCASGMSRRTHLGSQGVLTSAYVSIRPHTSAYVSIRQHTSAYVSTRQHTSACACGMSRRTQSATNVAMPCLRALQRMLMSAYVSIPIAPGCPFCPNGHSYVDITVFPTSLCLSTSVWEHAYISSLRPHTLVA